jgi:hypothetical protein
MIAADRLEGLRIAAREQQATLLLALGRSEGLWIAARAGA